MFGPKPPPTPDPYAVAAAQQKASIGIAVANTWLANANEVSPTGTVTYAQTGSYSWVDPIIKSDGTAVAGTYTYSVPIFTRTVAYTNAENTIFLADQAARGTLAQLAGDQASRLSLSLAAPIDLTALPAMASTPSTPSLTSTVPDQGPVIDTIGASDFADAKNAVISAINSRLQYQRDLDRDALTTKLANQGVLAGSEAFNNAMRVLEFRSADEQLQAILAGGQEQTRLFALEKGRADFYNAAQQQRFTQATLVIEITNRVAIQVFTVALQIADFVNTTRERTLQENMLVRNASLNELATLMRGTTLPVPQFTQYKSATIQTADIQGAVYASAQLEQQRYKAQVEQQSAIIGGIATIAGSALAGPIGSKLLNKFGSPNAIGAP